MKDKNLDFLQSLPLFSIAFQEAVLSLLQSLLAVIQTWQCLQNTVTPHDVQLQHCVVIHCVQQRRVTLSRIKTITVTQKQDPFAQHDS